MLDAEAFEHPDQVLGGEVAGRGLGVRATAQTARRGVHCGHALAERGQGVRQRLAVGVVEVHRQPVHADPGRDERAQQGLHVPRGGHPDGVAERELVAPHVEQALARRDDLLDRDGTFPRVAEAHRQVPAHRDPLADGARHHRFEHGELLVEAAVEVALREGLGGRGEDRDVADLRLQRPVQAALVGNQDGVLRARGLVEAVEELGGVGQLRDPLGVHEAGRFQHDQARVGQPPQELQLDLERNDLLLVLQSVPRADLPDRHLSGQLPRFRRGDRHRQAQFTWSHQLSCVRSALSSTSR